MGVEAVDQLLDGKSNIVICEVDGKITTCDIGKALRVDRLFKGKCTPEEIAAFDPEEKKWMDARCEKVLNDMKKLYDIAYEVK
jgi:hypothetical protein